MAKKYSFRCNNILREFTQFTYRVIAKGWQHLWVFEKQHSYLILCTVPTGGVKVSTTITAYIQTLSTLNGSTNTVLICDNHYPGHQNKQQHRQKPWQLHFTVHYLVTSSFHRTQWEWSSLSSGVVKRYAEVCTRKYMHFSYRRGYEDPAQTLAVLTWNILWLKPRHEQLCNCVFHSDSVKNM